MTQSPVLLATDAHRRARALRLAIAREDARECMRLVLKDEQTGRAVAMAPYHDEWQRLIDQHPRTVIWSHVEAGKTNQITVGRVLFELGRNPGLRVAVVSNTAGQAKKIVRSIAQYIKKSVELRSIFPGLVPSTDPSLPWNSEALTVERSVLSKDASVQACGVHGNITGARIDLLILDDILDFENTRSVHAREDLWAWVKSTLMGRLTADARVVVVGNAWHPEDLLHRLAAEPHYIAKSYPVLDDLGRPTWPARWPLHRIAEARTELGPAEFNRQLMNKARDDADSRFKREWVDTCLRRGEGFRLIEAFDDNGPEGTLALLGEGFGVYTGVDLAVQTHSAADLTSFVTILVHPDDTRQILNIESGRWTGPDIVKRLDSLSDRFGSIFIVENVAAQDYILQFTRVLSAATVRPFTTGRNKAHPVFGVEGLAAELENGKWIIPSKGLVVVPEIAELVKEILYYEPPPKHTGDRLMAMWFAREGARSYRGKRNKTGGVGLRSL